MLQVCPSHNILALMSVDGVSCKHVVYADGWRCRIILSYVVSFKWAVQAVSCFNSSVPLLFHKHHSGEGIKAKSRLYRKHYTALTGSKYVPYLTAPVSIWELHWGLQWWRYRWRLAIKLDCVNDTLITCIYPSTAYTVYHIPFPQKTREVEFPTPGIPSG